MTTYVMNTLITPINFDQNKEVKINMRRITIEEAKNILSKGFTSAIGHEGTAKVLSQILAMQIPTERKTIFFKKGDVGIHFFLKERLPEGKILMQEELEKLDYWLVLSQVVE